MVTRRMRSPTTGEMVDAEVIDIKNTSDTAIQIKLADDTVLRLKIDVIEVVRFEGEWDAEGHPRYTVKSGTSMAVLDSPEHLRKEGGNRPLQ